MSSALTLVVITVFFVFHRLLMLFMIKLYLRIFFLLSEKTFIFIFLQNERKFGSKFAIILVIPRDNLFFCLWKLLEPQAEEKLVISMLTTMQSCLIFLVKPLKRRIWKIGKSWKNSLSYWRYNLKDPWFAEYWKDAVISRSFW